MMQLDLSKDYDKASWNYLEAILKAFGFASHWIRWIMALIKSTRFSIMVNGAPANQFTPSRGLRQGDPLSPFPFVILMEGLSRLIRHAKEEGKIKGLQLLPSIPGTTHQQFVDDTMLHGSPIVKEDQGYKNILNLLSEASGNLPSRYLGAPLSDKLWQKSHWEKILDNLKKRCQHWTHRALNLAGRLVLTKAVLQAIPQYFLSIIPAPQGILQQIRSIQRTFLWSGNAEERKWSLVAWNKLCKPKSLGGLNLLDPLTINKACGAKLWWKWLKEPNLPWARH
eukprot:PITA_24648